MTEFNPFIKKTGGMGDVKNAPQAANRPSTQKSGSSSMPQLNIKPSIFVVIVATVVLCGYLIFSYLNSSKPKTEETGETVNEKVTLMKNTSVLFLNHYLNLNYSVFKEERSAAEAFMTPELLSEYKESFYDNLLVQKVLMSEFSTDFYYNSIIPIIYKDAEGTQWPAIKVIGMAKYTAMTKNVGLEMPFTVILVYTKDAEGKYKKIDNIKFE